VYLKNLKQIIFKNNKGEGLMTHSSIPKEKRKKRRITDNLIRLSVRIEDLLNDLENAFQV